MAALRSARSQPRRESPAGHSRGCCVTTFLDIALQCAARGWYIFPCKPRSKRPATKNGFKDATLDVEQILAWWAKMPDAIVAIACGASGLAVFDVDHGLNDWDG